MIAGPLYVKLENPGIVAIRLIEFYEAVLKLSGVNKYFFGVSEENSTMIEMAIRLFEIEPHSRSHGKVWFLREMR